MTAHGLSASNLSTADIWSGEAVHSADLLRAQWTESIKRPIILYGAGHTGRLVLASLRKAGVTPVCFADDTSSKHGTTLDRIPILPLKEALAKVESTACVIVCVFHPLHRFQVSEQKIRAAAYGQAIDVLPFFTALYGLNTEPFYFFDSPKAELDRMPYYRVLRTKLGDLTSLRALEDHLRLRLQHNTSLAWDARDNVPLPAALLRSGLTYIDAGAYDGDTLALFMHLSGDTHKRIIALEPDAQNAAKLKEWRSAQPEKNRSRIEIVSKGLWHEECEIGFSATGDMGAKISAEERAHIRVTTLDALAAQISAPSLAKLDIEGAEIEALSGAVQFARSLRPAFAIAVYHKPSDLAKVFAWLEATRNNYQYGLRCHGGDGTDLMLYAW